MWFIILALLSAVIYVNQVGLPNFVQRPLLEKLRARGLDLQFSRLRLRWYQGIVAENVKFWRTDEPLSPELTLAEVGLSLNPRALAKLQFQVDSLTLHKGRLIWPLGETNGRPRQLTLDNIQTRLRLLPDDQWLLDDFSAAFAGAKIQLSGMVTNASAVRQWKFLTAQETLPAGTLQNRLRQLADTLEAIRFSAPPALSLDVRGDALDLQSFKIHFHLNAPYAETPWGTASQARFTARFLPAAKNQPMRAELNLSASGAATPWAATTNLQLSVHLAAVEKQTNLVNAELALSADKIETRWGSGTNAHATASWTHALTNPVPLFGQGRLRCERAETELAGGATAGTLELNTGLAEAGALLPIDPSWAWWTNLQPFALDWECRVTSLHTPKLQAEAITGGGRWRAPELTLTNLHADLYEARVNANAELDVATRALRARLDSDVDPHRIESLLTEGAKGWLAQFSWKNPPQLRADVALVLPAWTNRQPDWRAEVQPSLALEGEFKITLGGAYRQVRVDTAQSHFSYSNMVWRLPDLTVTAPEGHLTATHQADDRTKDFYWRIQSEMDTAILRPFLDTNQQRALDLLQTSEPPVVSGELRGRWHEPDKVTFKGQVALTNFTIRGETLSGFQSLVEYSNKFLLLTGAQAQRGAQRLSAASLGVDISAEKIYLADGFSTAEPQVVARAIGPKVGQALEPYRFVEPPTARVHGIIPIRDESMADLIFDIDGGPFHWWKFNLGHVAGRVHWKGEHLSLKGVRADFYGGKLTGSAAFDFRPRSGADYLFDLTVTNTVLKSLMADVFTRTNQLEGLLSGQLVVNQANTADWRSCQGGGDVRLKDGLIWDIPIFGVFSPVLNAVMPGLGSSRASAATGMFVIQNGVIRSDDLEIRSPAMRLEYRGSVDLQAQVNARVDAELLRDVWLLGPIFSTVLWPVTKVFEYKVTGSLELPKTEPVYLIPKLVLMPFHPFRALKDLLPEDSGPVRTNAPPATTP